MMCTQGLRDYDWIYSLQILAHFRSKVLEDFPHYVTQINCLTGAIISETYSIYDTYYEWIYLTTIRYSTIPYYLHKHCTYQKRQGRIFTSYTAVQCTMYNVQRYTVHMCTISLGLYTDWAHVQRYTVYMCTISLGLYTDWAQFLTYFVEKAFLNKFLNLQKLAVLCPRRFVIWTFCEMVIW